MKQNPLTTADIFLLVTQFLELEDVMKLTVVGKRTRMLIMDSTISNTIWRNLFLSEFYHDPKKFADLVQDQSVKMMELFQIAFQKYKRMRAILIDLIKQTELTNKELRFSGKSNLGIYLSKFSDRNQHSPFLHGLDSVTLEFICFHKNWQSVDDLPDEALESLQIKEKQSLRQYTGSLKKYFIDGIQFDDFSIAKVNFHDSFQDQVLLSIASMHFIRGVMLCKSGKKYLPVMGL